MKSLVPVLEALAHEVRLEVYQCLIQAGPPGLSAGALTSRVKVAPNVLSFHLNRLRFAGLVESRREGKQIIYTARFSRMESLLGFLTENCCRDSRQKCSPACATQSVKKSNITSDVKEELS